MSAEKTHWKKLDNPDYMGAYSFQPNEEKTLTIARVGQEEVYNPSSSKKETCTVAHFKENEKPMILNNTNCKMISKVHNTPYIDDWVGLAFVVGVQKVKAFGDVVDAVRIKNKKPNLEKFYCEDCKAEIVAMGTKSAKEMADIGKRNCGRFLCVSCMKIEKERMESRKEEEN